MNPDSASATSYLIEVPCVSSDQQPITLEVEINLVDKRKVFQHFAWSSSWLDNFYRPEVERAIQAFVTTVSIKTLRSQPESLHQRLQLIANEVCQNILRPQ